LNLIFTMQQAAEIKGPQIFNNVPLVDGYFNVILGTTDITGRSIGDIFYSNNRYLGIKYDSKEILPLQQILSVPYAIKSLHGVPVGSVMPYFGNSEPEGWLFCDGRSLTDASLTDSKYNALKSHLTNGGAASFPDLRGRFPLGRSDKYTLGSIGGEESHQLSTAELPSHSHPYMDVFFSEHKNNIVAPQIEVPKNMGSGDTDWDNIGHQLSRNTDQTGGNQPHNNMPPYMTLNYIIKY